MDMKDFSGTVKPIIDKIANEGGLALFVFANPNENIEGFMIETNMSNEHVMGIAKSLIQGIEQNTISVLSERDASQPS